LRADALAASVAGRLFSREGLRRNMRPTADMGIWGRVGGGGGGGGGVGRVGWGGRKQQGAGVKACRPGVRAVTMVGEGRHPLIL
jgi:hypothetical protein